MPVYLQAYVRNKLGQDEGPTRYIGQNDARTGFRLDPPPDPDDEEKRAPEEKADKPAVAAASAAAAPLKSLLSMKAVKKEIKRKLKSFPLRPEHDDRLAIEKEIRELRAHGINCGIFQQAPSETKPKAISSRRVFKARIAGKAKKLEPETVVIRATIASIKPDKIKERMALAQSRLVPTNHELFAAYIPLQFGEICILHRNGIPSAQRELLKKLAEAGKPAAGKPTRTAGKRKNIDTLNYSDIKADADKTAASQRALYADQTKFAAWDLLCHLDDYLGEPCYKVLDSVTRTPVKAAVAKAKDVKPVAAAGAAVAAPAAASAASGAGAMEVDAAPDLPAGADTKEELELVDVLQNLRRVSICATAFDHIEDATLREASGKPFREGGWVGCFKYMKLGAGEQFCDSTTKIPPEIAYMFSDPTEDKGRISAKKTIYAIWIPYQFFDYYYDDSDDAPRIVAKDGPLWRETYPPRKTGNEVDSSVYGVENGALTIYEYRASAPPSGGGGGGMRSDNPADAPYKWIASTTDGINLGISLGLDTQARVQVIPADFKDFEVRLPRSPAQVKTALPAEISASMSSEISYWKKFPDSPPRGKKNRPMMTKPLPARAMTRDGARLLYTKKQKGGWSASAIKNPVPIGGKFGARDSAGAVMQEALKTAGVYPGVVLASATDFAGLVVTQENLQTGAAVAKTDSAAKAAWKVLSAAVKPWAQEKAAAPAAQPGAGARPAGAQPAARPLSALEQKALRDAEEAARKQALDAAEKLAKPFREMIRTSQEWCHLVGHGDGGDEVFENFISGSQHCNTEQLAIETGQRTARAAYSLQDDKQNEIKLAVKVTGYLFPNDGIKSRRSAFLKSEADWLLSLQLLKRSATAVGQTPNIAETLAEIERRIALYDAYKVALTKLYAKATAAMTAAAAAAIAAKDPLGQLLTTGTIPTKEQWQAAETERWKPARDAKQAVLVFNSVSEDLRERLRGIADLPLPLGNYVRYKIFFQQEDKTYKKIFDHTFDAQKESLDFFEYKIIEATVRRVIAAAAERLGTYRSAIELKVQRLNDEAKTAAPAASANGT
ncbi:hypothetical protein [Bosea sp. (in: a-proteobacteria)]|uniref:hypothetical protein n=1 Tax=Bosea sp. (in: a-proteobacteria) TaxID=1871050 RepID=UPI0031FEC036